jgi:hypothetical protein
MIKYFFTLTVFALFLFTGTDCKKKPPVAPPDDTTAVDTTSHNFTWSLDSLGDPSVGTSSLYDVAIINDSDVWAVGEIYTTDSTGKPDIFPYNAAHWNGKQWKLKRFLFFTAQGDQNTIAYPCHAIFIADPTEIWIAAGDQVTLYNANTQIKTMFLPVSFSINKLWGSNTFSLYAAGSDGNIVYYDGGTWTKLESGTTLNLYDIWGVKNSATGETEILCIGSNYSTGEGPGIFEIKGTVVTSLSARGLAWDIHGIWFSSNKKYCIAGGGVFEKEKLSDSMWNTQQGIVQYEVGGIRGNDANDIFTAGSFGEIEHYNGISWHEYSHQLPLFHGGFSRIDIKTNIVAAVGSKGQSAAVLIGKRVQ